MTYWQDALLKRRALGVGVSNKHFRGWTLWAPGSVGVLGFTADVHFQLLDASGSPRSPFTLYGASQQATKAQLHRLNYGHSNLCESRR